MEEGVMGIFQPWSIARSWQAGVPPAICDDSGTRGCCCRCRFETGVAMLIRRLDAVAYGRRMVRLSQARAENGGVEEADV